MNWRTIVENVVRARSSRNAFPFPPEFAAFVYSQLLWETDRTRGVDTITRSLQAMEANLNGLCVDGAGI